MRPRIGLTTDHEDAPARAALRDSYYDAVHAAGGVPLLLPPIADERYIEAALSSVDAVLIGGGDDLHPSLWGEAEVHPACTLVTARRQAFDLAVARAAAREGLPLLGICCGMQVMNVAFGGGVVQHLLPERPGGRAHKPPKGDPPIEHDVRVAPGSLLAKAAGGRGSIRVNSYHHQACGALGRGLSATAWADDGVIEGIEGPAGTFRLGVQWHPEKLLERPEHRAVFDALVEAAAGRRAARSSEGALAVH